MFVFSDLCGVGNITLDSGQVVNLTSPLFPYRYSHYTSCTWIITASTSGSLILEFALFHLEDGYDFLFLGTGNRTTEESRILSMTGTELNIPKSTILLKSSVWLMFMSDTSWHEDGFLIHVTSSETNG